MQLNDVLKYAHKLVIVLQAKLNNTVRQEVTFPYANAGGIAPNAGHEAGIIYKSNSAVSISNDRPLHGEVSQAMVGGLTITSSLPAPFTGAAGTRTLANVSLVNISSIDDFARRDWDDRSVLVKVGGLVHKGEANEQTLELSEYVPWINGRFLGRSVNTNSIDVAIGMNSDELLPMFPKNIYSSGESQGLAKPFMFGQVNGYKARQITKTGVAQWHDGKVDITDEIWPHPDVWYFTENTEFNLGYNTSESPSNNTAGYNVKTLSDFEWTQIDDVSVEAIGSFPAQISVEGDGVEIVANSDNTVTLQRNGSSSSYSISDFKWTQNGAQGARTIKGPIVDAITTGGVDVVFIGGYWFKVGASNTDSGTVTLDFDSNVGELDLILYSQKNPSDTISGWSHAPQSIQKLDKDGTKHRYLAKFRGINTDSLSFNYQGTGGLTYTSIWFQSLSFYEVEPATVTLDFDGKCIDLEVGILIDGGSQGFTEWSPSTLSANPVDGIKSNVLFESELNQIKFKYDVGYGSTKLSIESLKVSSSAFGAFRDKRTFRLVPPPQTATNEGKARLECVMPSTGYPASGGKRFAVKFKARVPESVDIDRVFFKAFFPGINIHKAFEAGKDWKEFTIDTLSVSYYGSNFQFLLARGHGTGDSWPQTNPDVPVALEIEDIAIVRKDRNKAQISLYDDNAGALTYLSMYRVNNAKSFKALPMGIAVFDDNGYYKASTEYNNLIGDFVGWKKDAKSIESFRKMSELATGSDLINCDFNGETVGFVLDVQAPWKDQVDSICAGIDYYTMENLVSDGIEINRRYAYDDYPTDFVIEESQIIKDSVSITNSAPRESRYIFEYDRNYSNPSLTKTAESPVGHVTARYEPKIIPTVLKNLSDVQNLAKTIHRDSEKNDLMSLSLKGVGIGLAPGMAGFINDDGVPKNKPCIISQVVENANSIPYKTTINFKVLKGGGVHA